MLLPEAERAGDDGDNSYGSQSESAISHGMTSQVFSIEVAVESVGSHLRVPGPASALACSIRTPFLRENPGKVTRTWDQPDVKPESLATKRLP